ESDMFTTYAFDEAKYKNYNRLTNPQNIAKQHGLVFAMNTDFFIYRVGRQKEVNYVYPIGIVIRRGNLMYDVPKKPNSTVYPPLDVAAFYPNGNMEVFLNSTTTGQALLDSGAQDVLSFGPILVENGEVSPRASAFGDVDNPRTAIGMVERGHYYCVLLEGRLASSYSVGGSCMWMADTMARLGCKTAINLDGGQTACMIFMGSRINKIGTYSGSATDKDRDQNEVLGIGHSELVK
ncbi:MAG: phosphodiester glycosidase family protein, partial [Clostridia bacterium]|nr:phosphodiester glycosidase family protein [Clostridia bacterium]